jgi:Cadherin-like domain
LKKRYTHLYPLIVYTPASGFSGSDSFIYQVNDGNGGTDTATVTLTVTVANLTGDASNNTQVGTNAANATDLTGDANNNTLVGTNFSDTLTGSDGVFVAQGGAGNDSINVIFTATMKNSSFVLNLTGDESVMLISKDFLNGNDVITLLGSYARSNVDLGGGNDLFVGGWESIALSVAAVMTRWWAMVETIAYWEMRAMTR